MQLPLCTRCEFPLLGSTAGLCRGCKQMQRCAEAARPAGKRSAAGRGASVSTIPVGNHGDNLKRSSVRTFVHLGLPEARYYLGCKGHMHAFSRVGYRSGAFVEDVRHVGTAGTTA